jgi:hypothetical protein
MFKCKQVLLNGKGERDRDKGNKEAEDAWKMIDHET